MIKYVYREKHEGLEDESLKFQTFRHNGHILANVSAVNDAGMISVIAVNVKKLRDQLNTILDDYAQGSPNPTKQ